jgi:peptide deformylase
MIITNEKFLRNKSIECISLEEVVEIDKKLRQEFVGKNAIGLAAPQIGILKRMFVMEVNDELITLVHPKIIKIFDNDNTTNNERCLSFPDMVVEVTRPADILITDATEKEHHLLGWNAIVFQHELDHLNGVLFYDVGKILFSRRVSEKINRNSPCPCGATKDDRPIKYKNCHGR